MWLTPITTPTTAQWISLDDAKTYLRVDSTDDDALIATLIDVAQSNVETNTGLRFFTQTVSLSCSEWADLARIPVGPISTITEITYIDREGVSQTLDPSFYALFGGGTLRAGVRTNVGKVFPLVASYEDAITVSVTVGFGADVSAVPQGLVRALMLTLGDYYEFRADTIAERSVTPNSLPVGVENILLNYRVF